MTRVVVEIPLEGCGDGMSGTLSAINVRCEFLDRWNIVKTACRGSAMLTMVVPVPEGSLGFSLPVRCQFLEI
jgi:hypothetical protein